MPLPIDAPAKFLHEQATEPVAVTPTSSTAQTTLCLPVLLPDMSGIHSMAQGELDRLHLAIGEAVASLGIEAYIGRNNPFSLDYSVLFEAWVPVYNDRYLTKRVSARLQVWQRPSHAYPLEYWVTINDAAKDKGTKARVYASFSNESVARLINYLVRGGVEPVFPHEIRQPHHKYLQALGKLKNKPIGVRPSYLATFAAWSITGGFISLFLIGVWPLPAILAALTLILLGFVILGFTGVKQTLIRSTGRPDFQPRVLRFYDTWQVVLSGAGSNRDVFFDRFLEVLRHSPIPDFKAQNEPVAYRVTGELVSRDQLVLSARRALVYCQIYPFGNDLYVGWQSFLNRGCWAETLVTEGIEKTSKRYVKLQSVQIGTEGLCEYDFVDANCLTEWTHAQMVILIKQLMAELQIDQEIDFKIVRGSRDAAENTTAPQAAQKKAGGLFRRKN
jgi:hypothetical protein